MEELPFVFIDSIAHLVFKNSAGNFSHLQTGFWSSIGQTHQEKRVDYYFKVQIVDDLDISYDLFNEHGDSVPIKDILSSDCRYVRILRYDLHNMSTMDREFEDDQFKLFLDITSRIPIHKLYVWSEENSVKEIGVLWKIPVESFLFGDIGLSLEIIDFHLFQNEHLKTFEVGWANYDLMSRLVKSFQRGEMVEKERTGKRLDDLKELGFVKNADGSYELNVKGYHDGKLRTVRFYKFVT